MVILCRDNCANCDKVTRLQYCKKCPIIKFGYCNTGCRLKDLKYHKHICGKITSVRTLDRIKQLYEYNTELVKIFVNMTEKHLFLTDLQDNPIRLDDIIPDTPGYKIKYDDINTLFQYLQLLARAYDMKAVEIREYLPPFKHDMKPNFNRCQYCDIPVVD